ncbi:hypothetical protein D3OALGA1CA_1746 [Olavius algarvensis associated proteobacterium Delta 3]|nr:hypothetical protein D3OALGA1CA_1746 [Olavius algarvensis associated proteobacterium Delta 3]
MRNFYCFISLYPQIPFLIHHQNRIDKHFLIVFSKDKYDIRLRCEGRQLFMFILIKKPSYPFGNPAISRYMDL